LIGYARVSTDEQDLTAGIAAPRHSICRWACPLPSGCMPTARARSAWAACWRPCRCSGPTTPAGLRMRCTNRSNSLWRPEGACRRHRRDAAALLDLHPAPPPTN